MTHRAHEGMLEPLGVSPAEERVYLFLLAHPRASYPEIVEGTGLAAARVRTAVALLESKAVVSRSIGRSPRFVPSPPSVTLQGLVYRRLGEIEEAKAEAEDVMAKLYAATIRSAADLVEVVTGEDAVRQRTFQMLLGAEHEVLELSRPPYPMSTEEVERSNLAKGIRYRYIYASATLEVPGRLDDILIDIAAGEQARVLPEVPLKLSIVDRRIARMFLSTDEPDVETGILTVRASPIVDALVVLFESLWERAVPLSPTTGDESAVADDDGPSPADRELLTLLAAGLTDEVIARHLQITTRSLRRRTVRLMALLHARSRFQAGVQAAARGWIQGQT
jgi:sugar-specific transcriptional regulator TrmB/DNA-binding CsgD family transcriptional regulator